MKFTKPRSRFSQVARQEEQGDARIRKWLQTVRFRKAMVGGVLESDVWKKIGELNELYEAALVAERARYDALLEERTGKGQVILPNEEQI